MPHGRVGRGGADVQVVHRQERQGEHHPGRVLAGMVEVAHVGHLDGAELDRIEVLLVLGEHLAVADLDGELAARALLQDGSDPLDPFRIGAALAPVGMPPFDGRAIDGLRDRCRRGDRTCQHDTQGPEREAFHRLPPLLFGALNPLRGPLLLLAPSLHRAYPDSMERGAFVDASPHVMRRGANETEHQAQSSPPGFAPLRLGTGLARIAAPPAVWCGAASFSTEEPSSGIHPCWMCRGATRVRSAPSPALAYPAAISMPRQIEPTP